MKKVLMAGVAAALFSLASCSDDPKNEQTLTLPVYSYNLFTSVSGDSEPWAGKATYSMVLKYPANTISVTANSMPMPGGTTGTFVTKDMSMGGSTVADGDVNLEVIKFSMSDASQSGIAVNDLNGMLTQAAYAPGTVEVTGYDRTYPASTKHFLVMDYELGGAWRVRTFWPDMTFVGKTVTTNPDEEVPYETNNIRYRLYMKMEANGALTGKADMIFYDAKFANKAPELTILLPGLDVKFTNAGYTVSGSEVVPSMYEGSAFTELQKFTFNSFKMDVAGDLTSAVGSYQVAGIYNGTFQASSVVK